MEPKDRLELAQELVNARRTSAAIQAPTARETEFSMADAYAVAALVDREWSDADHQCNGVKIGLTDRAKWAGLGICAPVWGRTYADTTVDAASTVDIASLVAPRVEAEVVVGLDRALDAGASAAEVVEAVAWAALGFELVDSHVVEWKMKPADLVADFGVHAGLVLGPRRRLTPDELMALGQMTVELTNGTKPPVPGRGDAVIGGPVHSIVAHLASADAVGLDSGFVVSTGSLTGTAHAVAPGERWCLRPDSGPLTGVELSLSAMGGRS